MPIDFVQLYWKWKQHDSTYSGMTEGIEGSSSVAYSMNWCYVLAGKQVVGKHSSAINSSKNFSPYMKWLVCVYTVSLPNHVDWSLCINRPSLTPTHQNLTVLQTDLYWYIQCKLQLTYLRARLLWWMVGPHASCSVCHICMVVVGGGCSGMLLLHAVQTSTDACLLCSDLCTLHPDLWTLCLWCFPSFNGCKHSTCSGGGCHQL